MEEKAKKQKVYEVVAAMLEGGIEMMNTAIYNVVAMDAEEAIKVAKSSHFVKGEFAQDVRLLVVLS